MKTDLKELLTNLRHHCTAQDRANAVEAIETLSLSVTEANARAKLIADTASIHAERMREAMDPDTLEAIADEIGGEFKHSARADSLRVIARKQREVLPKAD